MIDDLPAPGSGPLPPSKGSGATGGSQPPPPPKPERETILDLSAADMVGNPSFAQQTPPPVIPPDYLNRLKARHCAFA